MLKGLNAVVTGSTSGIGLGIAKCLAGQGVNITINGRRQSDHRAIDITKQIQALGVSDIVHVPGFHFWMSGAALFCVLSGVPGYKKNGHILRVVCDYDGADMSDVEQVQALIQRSKHRMGSVDILVNNAGLQHIEAITTYPIHSVIPVMRSGGFGRIINIASVHGLVASLNKSAYVAAKHALVGLTKASALDVANDGITVNAICPGYVWDGMGKSQVEKFASAEGISVEAAASKLVSDKQPMHQFAKPEDIGQMVVHLCTPHANLITGTCIEISGGWTAQ